MYAILVMKDIKVMGHIPWVNCSAMIAFSYNNLKATICMLPVYCDTWLHCKAHPPDKGCVIRDKNIGLTDEYGLNSEVCLTSGFYGMCSALMQVNIITFCAKVS